MDPGTMALISGGVRVGGALLSYIQRKKRRTPTFASTPYGKRLQQISRRGIYSPSAKSAMLGETSRRLSASIQPEIVRRRGMLESKGMGKSIAGARYTGEPALERARGVGEAARKIELENELAKESAATEFARRQTATEEQRRQERIGGTQALFGGLTEAAGAGLEMYMKGKQIKDLADYRKKMGESYIIRARTAGKIAEANIASDISDKNFQNKFNQMQMLFNMGDVEEAKRIYEELYGGR